MATDFPVHEPSEMAEAAEAVEATEQVVVAGQVQADNRWHAGDTAGSQRMPIAVIVGIAGIVAAAGTVVRLVSVTLKVQML